MKNNIIIRIIVWSLVLLALVGVTAALMADELYLRSYEIAATEPVIYATEAAVTPVQSLPNEETISFSPELIREIDIEWAAGDIVILARDVETIRISESDVSDEKYALMYHTDGDSLDIAFCEESIFTGLSLGSNVSKDLYIEVPVDWEGRSIEIDAAAANVELQDMTLIELDIDGADGTCDFRNCHILDLDIDTASGSVYYQGSLDTLDFDSVSATFIGDFQNTPSRIDMDGMSGKLDIALPQDCGYTLTIDGMSSHFSSEFTGTDVKNGSHVYGDGRCRINVDGMSCDVYIRALVCDTIDPTEETQ